jgi:hypothetical protein
MGSATSNAYPIVIHRIDGCMSVHAASFKAIRAALPSPALNPLRLPDGRAMVAISLYEKRAATATTPSGTVSMPPYAELPVTAIVTRRPLSRTLGAIALGGSILGASPVRLGGVGLTWPMTSAAWAEAGRASMGLPMFVADFEIDVGEHEWQVTVSEDSRLIARLTLRAGGALGVDRMMQSTYGAIDGRLASARIDSEFVRRRRLRGGATLELGADHPVASRLRELELSPIGIGSWTYLGGRAVLHAPAALAAPASPVPGHPGRDVPLGKYLVRQPGTGWMDWYGASAWEMGSLLPKR